MIESDWKKYSAMVPALRERYLKAQNTRIAEMLSDPKKNETDRFYDALEEMKKQVKTLQHCLDDHARSQMYFHLVIMLKVGMATPADLVDFSAELRQQVLEAADLKSS